MTSNTATSTSPDLEPSYILPIVVCLLALPLVFLNLILGGIVGSFGVFLTIQAATIRLRFTETSLEVYRSGTKIRDFPYTEWQNWRVYFPSLPILFYFKEVNSIHFLPMLFSPKQLQDSLKDLPRID